MLILWSSQKCFAIAEIIDELSCTFERTIPVAPEYVEIAKGDRPKVTFKLPQTLGLGKTRDSLLGFLAGIARKLILSVFISRRRVIDSRFTGGEPTWCKIRNGSKMSDSLQSKV